MDKIDLEKIYSIKDNEDDYINLIKSIKEKDNNKIIKELKREIEKKEEEIKEKEEEIKEKEEGKKGKKGKKGKEIKIIEKEIEEIEKEIEEIKKIKNEIENEINNEIEKIEKCSNKIYYQERKNYNIKYCRRGLCEICQDFEEKLVINNLMEAVENISNKEYILGSVYFWKKCELSELNNNIDELRKIINNKQIQGLKTLSFEFYYTLNIKPSFDNLFIPYIKFIFIEEKEKLKEDFRNENEFDNIKKDMKVELTSSYTTIKSSERAIKTKIKAYLEEEIHTEYGQKDLKIRNIYEFYKICKLSREKNKKVDPLFHWVKRNYNLKFEDNNEDNNIDTNKKSYTLFEWKNDKNKYEIKKYKYDEDEEKYNISDGSYI